jgi:uncharacterized phage protein (TIGR01671 family)
MTNQRTIKFRVWDKQEKSFYSEEHLKHFNVAVSWDGKTIYQNFISGEKIVGDEVIIQQSTGLHDKNGIEIFEGDIVMLNLNDEVECNATVVWQVCEYVFEMHILEQTPIPLGEWYEFNECVNCELTGNIFQS